MSANRSNIDWHLHNMIGAPAANATVRIIFKTEDGIMLCYATAAVSATALTAANTFAPGCIYIKVVAASPSKVYVNIGTAATPSWSALV